MSSNHTELIEVLRGFGGTHREAMGWLSEAADALQRQAEETAIHHKNIERLDSIIHEQAAEIEALRADAERLLVACQNARDIIATDRQAFVDCQRCRDTRTERPIEYGLVWVDEETWLAPQDAEPLRDYDRALAAIDSAMQGVTG